MPAGTRLKGATLKLETYTAGAARRKLMYWISLQPALVDALHASGFSQKVRSFTPAQVRLIVEALGEP
uniref:DUF4248 domain-containing protein n=1 Tax=Phocaeicola coprophilus TaxID=387090 RepID=UPI003078C1C2